MIEGKIIKFGYGDILVGADSMFGILSITNIEPPQEVGSAHRVNEHGITAHENVQFQYQLDMDALLIKLKNLRELGEMQPELRRISFRGYTFDFSAFNLKSVDVVIKFIKRAMCSLALAC